MKFYFLAEIKRKTTMWIAWHLPKYLVMWCYYRVAAHATGGKWSNDGVPSVTMMNAIERWGQSNKSLQRSA